MLIDADCLSGGVDPGPQLKRLRAGVDIVCGTPGRVWDLVSSGKLVLSGVQVQSLLIAPLIAPRIASDCASDCL